MATNEIKVTVEVPGLTKIRQAVLDSPQLAKDIVGVWKQIYRSFIRQRFVSFSRGGGDWPPLKPSTLAKRRKGKGSGTAAILRDTGLLFASLQPGVEGTGLLQATDRPLGFTAFMDSKQTYAKGGGVSLGDVANFHQTGAGRLPVRKIIDVPDRDTVAQMGEKAHKIITGQINRRAG